jgi:hypothetical protein
MRVTVRTVSAAVLATIALSSCSPSKSESAAPTATSVPSGSATTINPAPSAILGPATASDLGRRLVTRVPAGFVLQPDDVGDTGPSDLAKAVRDDPSPDAEEALRSEGFVQGYQRLWVGPDDAEIIVFVYQFGTEAGAAADFRRSKAALADEALPGATEFTVSGLPAGQTNAVTGSSGDLSAAIVQFTTGVYNVQLVCNGPASSGLQSRVSAIAKDQYDVLRG